MSTLAEKLAFELLMDKCYKIAKSHCIGCMDEESYKTNITDHIPGCFDLLKDIVENYFEMAVQFLPTFEKMSLEEKNIFKNNAVKYIDSYYHDFRGYFGI